MTRITPRLREEACQLLSAAASNELWHGYVTFSLGKRGIALANAAYAKADSYVPMGDGSTTRCLAEAECLLRCGVCPPGWRE
jgi:hypothetical protein